MMLTDEQWEKIKDLLPEPKRRRDGKGRPWAPNRACFEGILMGAANRGSLARPAEAISQRGDLFVIRFIPCLSDPSNKNG